MTDEEQPIEVDEATEIEHEQKDVSTAISIVSVASEAVSLEEGEEFEEQTIQVIPAAAAAAAEELEEIEEDEPFISVFDILDAPRELPEPIHLTLDVVKQIRNELGIITLCWPDIKDPKFEKRAKFPESYVKNSNKEKLLLLYAENFRRQFNRLHSNRKPLFLACANEIGLVKMVCTTLRPTTLPHPEIETWEECANFVGDQLKYEILETPTLLPNRLHSPHTTFLRQSGHSFEIATALCSLLLGLGYDAYVVSGYAIQDVCLKIMTRVNSPFPPEEEEKEAEAVATIDAKYILKPAKDLRSKFLLAMAQREIDKVKEEIQKGAEMERQRLEELEKPPFDEIYGQRVHAWVLLLAGAREVETSVFIEASTGTTHTLNTSIYCGIESVWNHNNYWVNLQNCGNGLDQLDYQFSNIKNWEHFLIGEPLKWRESAITQEMEEDEIQLLQIMEEKHLDMPTPWSLPIFIPHNVLKQRFPDGVKKTWFMRTLVEQFTPHIQQDGLVTRVCRYKDLECSPAELQTIEEHYENRIDNLTKIISDCNTGWIVETYERGREDAAKSSWSTDKPKTVNLPLFALAHTYKCGQTSSVESARIIDFFHDARHDGLSQLKLDPLFLTEHYINREDFVFFRHADYDKRGDEAPGNIANARRTVLKIVEKFNRNEKKPASTDIAVREFAISSREIHLKFHYEEGKVTASTRDFIKPPLAEMGDQLKFNPSLTVGYQAEIGSKPPRQLQLFLLLEQQLMEEEKTLYHLREVEDQVLEFLKLRNFETAIPKLSVSLFDREQNHKHRSGLKEREQKEKEHKEREVEDEIDYLAPYVARFGSPAKLSLAQANKVRDWCLTEFKQMLLRRANAIHYQFEKETTKLQEKQTWYVTVQDTLKAEEELEYLKDISKRIFLLHTLEMRLARHRDLSPYRYEALENFLKLDQRLKPKK